MPFTPSHAAAALPFLRTPLPAAALVLGTVAPDLPYFVPVGIPRELTHSLVGAVTVDPLIALVALALWWGLFRAPIVDLAPPAVRRRMPGRPRLGHGTHRWRFLLLSLAGALLGIATHLLWDWFTHPAGFVDLVPAWRTAIGPFPVYRWLQYAGSAFGLLALAVWGVRWARRTAESDAPAFAVDVLRRAGWLAVIAVGVLVAVAVWIAGVRSGEPPLAPPLVFRTLVFSIGSAGACAVVVCAVWWVARAWRRSRGDVRLS